MSFESMTYQSPPPTYYSYAMSNNNNRSYSPELNNIDSPTYSFSSSSSHISSMTRPSVNSMNHHYYEEQLPMIKKEEIYPYGALSNINNENNTLIKREVLSPLPDSFYDAYSYQLTTPSTTGLPLLTPPATEYYGSTKKEELDFQDNFICYNNNQLPPPPPPMNAPSCYTPGCNCSMTGNNNNVFYNNGMMSPNPMFYDPLPYNIMALPPPSSYFNINNSNNNNNKYMNKRPYQGKQINRHYSLDSIHTTISTSSQKTSASSSSNSNASSSNSSTPRRYKCTLCVKRFTRPSSLATHMHSHTGEVTT